MITLSDCALDRQGGFAALEMGTARVQNSASILMKNLADVFYSSVAFYLFGFSLAFSCDEKVNNTFIGIGSYNPERELDFGMMQDPSSSRFVLRLFVSHQFFCDSISLFSNGVCVDQRHDCLRWYA